MRIKLLFCCILLISLIACDRPACTNANPIFDQNEPSSKIYKDELVKQIKLVEANKLKYWLAKYEKEQGAEFLHFHVQGEGLCAQMVLTMNQWNKLENVRKLKGKSYIGAEFTNLVFDIQQDTKQTAFVYKDTGRIID